VKRGVADEGVEGEAARVNVTHVGKLRLDRSEK
jgi:hypothetical protein